MDIAINGGKRLSGTAITNTSKNGTVALLAASLLNRAPTTLHAVPRIEEVNRLLEVMRSIGVETEWNGDTLTLTPPAHFSLDTLDTEAAMRTRSIILFIGALMHHMSTFTLPQSGGCLLGSRTVRPHFFALEHFGVTIETTDTAYNVAVQKHLPERDIVLYESGDTVTENALLAAALTEGETVIKYASANYMVQELCCFLEQCGVRIEGVGTSTLRVHGVREINTPVSYTLAEDPIDSMFFIAAAIATNSAITITRCPIDFLELELLKLEKMGFRYAASTPYLSVNGRTRLVDITTEPSTLTALEEKIHPNVYPGLNIDNLPFFGIIATQAHGTTLIHDWVYEKRAEYFMNLVALGAHVELLDPHRARISGPTTFTPADLTCPPALRPATILLIGMLAAEGHSVLRNVYAINRGYADIVGRLHALGADIEAHE